MSSGSSTPPPPSIAAAGARAHIDQVAVRLIFVPDDLKNQSQSLRISGTVTGKNPDGTVDVHTDKGDIRILLRDKGSLPQGLKIDIEIPAGRNPQQAQIRQSPESPSLPQSEEVQNLAQTLRTDSPVIRTSQNQPDSQSTRTTTLPPQNTTLQAETLETVITTSQSLRANTQQTSPLPPIAAGPLQAGQMIRLIPIPPGTIPQTFLDMLSKPKSLPDLLRQFISMIDTIPAGQTELRTSLIQILSKLDLTPLKAMTVSSSALTNSPDLTQPPATVPNGFKLGENPVSNSPVPKILDGISSTPTFLNQQLPNKIDSLLESIGLPSAFKGTAQPPLSGNINNLMSPTSPQQAATINSPSTGTPAISSLAPLPPSSLSPLSLFNPSKPLDGQIIAFQNAAQSPVTYIVGNGTAPSSSLFQNAPVSPAQVLGVTHEGLPILSVSLPHTGLSQIYTLQFKANNLPQDTPVFLALDPSSTKSAQAVFIQTPDGGISLQQNISKIGLEDWIKSGTWDTLDDLFKTLSHIAPIQSQNFSHMIPTPSQPQSMAALSLFFLSVLRSGDTETWMGSETVSLLRQLGKTDILRSLTTDIVLASRLDQTPLPQDWRMTMLPLLWDQQIHKMPVYYKHMPDDGDKEQAESRKRRKLRFLFDLQLSRMGGVQVDGFMQSERLDIILRTKSPMSPAMQSQMKRIYAGAMDKSRLVGELSFQFKPEQWVDFSQIPEKTGLQV